MATPKYRCAQKDLYPALRLAIKKLMTIQAKLAGFKGKYIIAFFVQLLRDVDAAEAKPDHEARMVNVNSLILDVEAQEKNVLNYSVMLESYIRSAFDKEKHSIMIDAAGGNYWKKAQKGDANSVQGLSSGMTYFVNEYKDTLMANNNMPARILTEIVAVDATYRQLISDLENATALVPGTREDKINANNDIYDAVMDGLMDAQSQDATNLEWVREYTFIAFLSQVRGTPNAGFSGRITEEDGKTGVAKALVCIQGTNIVVETDEQGRYEVTPLSMSKIVVIVKKQGYIQQIFDKVVIKTGVMTRLNVKLARAA